MSLRNSIFTLCLLALAGCGFQPVYGKKNESSGTLLGGVRVESPSGRPGQQLRINLEDRLNPSGAIPPNPAYYLKTDLTTTSTPIGVARDGTVSRYNIYLISNYSLYSSNDNKLLTKGTIQQVSSYNNVTNAYFSTYISESDAIKRGIEELSEQYRQRLVSYFNHPEPVPVTESKPRQEALPPPSPLFKP